MNQAIDFEQWEVVEALLPQGWEEDARSTGALIRARGVPSSSVLLRLIMLHSVSGLSLVDTVARARLAGLCDISSVALHGRLKVAVPWLQRLCSGLLRETVTTTEVFDKHHRWRVIDASDIQEPGLRGSRWRLHYSLLLPSLECDHFALSDIHQGETLRHWNIEKGDVVVADRGYSHRAGIAHVLEAGGDVVVRWQPNVFPLLEENGEPFDWRAWLEPAGSTQILEHQLYFKHGQHTYPIRLCGVKKSDQAFARALWQVRDKARRNQKKPSERSEFLARYTLILSLLPQQQYSARRLLEIYRCRWQVELAFKRLKSLLELGHLPKHDPQTAQAWLLSKLLAALLIEKSLRQAQLFSPWGFELPL